MSVLNMKSIVASAVMLSMAGCGVMKHQNEIKEANVSKAATVASNIESARVADKKMSAPMRIIDAVWLGSKTVNAARDADLPNIFHQSIAFQFSDAAPLSIVAERISKISGIAVRFAPDIDSKVKGSGSATRSALKLPPSLTGPIDANATQMMSGMLGTTMQNQLFIDAANPFKGTLAELLEKVSAAHSIGWDYKDGAIFFSRYVTKTYQLSSMLDTNKFTANIAKKGDTGTKGAEGGTSSSKSDVSSEITATLDSVKGIEEAIKGMLTKDEGTYSVSSSGLITVTDTREVQEQVRELIKAENAVMGRQVKLRLQFVQVETTQEDGFSVDWTRLIDQATSKWKVDFNTNAKLTQLSSGATLSQLGILSNGDTQTKLFLQALSEVGRVNVQSDETYLTLNNRMLSTASTETYMYPAKSVPATSAVLGVPSAPGVEPGLLTTGTFINMRSSIQPNGSVITQLSYDVSSRGASQRLGPPNLQLEFPSTSGTQYQIYASAVSGNTVVLAGIDNTNQNATERSLDASLSSFLGGSTTAKTSRRAILVLLTPTIVEGVN